MRKLLLKNYWLIAFVLVLNFGFASCSDDDRQEDNPPIESRIEIDKPEEGYSVKEGNSITIDPKVETFDGDQYSWILDGKVISTELILTFEPKQAGTAELSLLIVNELKNTRRTGNVKIEVIAIDSNYVVLNLNDFDLSDGKETAGGKYWIDTYSEDAILKQQIFTFNRNGMESWNYWEGFTISNSNENSDFGKGESGGWIPNQFCSMPKGGVDGIGTPFVVAYGMGGVAPAEGTLFTEDGYSNWIKIDDKDSYNAISINITNNPWAYYGILNGDSFAKAFEQGDYFALKIYGVDVKMNISKPVEFYLADYRSEKKDEWIVHDTWQKVDLSALGQVKYIFFLLESTDSGQWGMNTAAYYCLDKLTVDRVSK